MARPAQLRDASKRQRENGTTRAGHDVRVRQRKDEKLDRYTIEGLIWGRETLWFDANRNLVAAVTTDAEFDHFEAIRDGYESALGDFVGRAGADGMSALAEISKRDFGQPRLDDRHRRRHADRRYGRRAGCRLGGCDSARAASSPSVRDRK